MELYHCLAISTSDISVTYLVSKRSNYTFIDDGSVIKGQLTRDYLRIFLYFPRYRVLF